MHPLLTIAVRAAREAGSVITRNMNRIDQLTIESKQRHDFVSEVDRDAEQAVIEVIRKAYPDHSILAEESGHAAGDEFQWIIDPLDGTTNFLHGFPHYAVSIGLTHKGRLEQGVVYDPFKQELFTASRGEGAMLNNKRIRVTPVSNVEGAFIGTGFPFRNREYLNMQMQVVDELFNHVADIRRAGSAALDLAYVACGRLDGYWEFGLKPWDIAAGALLVREAGGIAGDVFGGGEFMQSGHIAVANPKLYASLVKSMNPYIQGLKEPPQA